MHLVSAWDRVALVYSPTQFPRRFLTCPRHPFLWEEAGTESPVRHLYEWAIALESHLAQFSFTNNAYLPPSGVTSIPRKTFHDLEI
jgi:hypothetical protein